MPKSKLVTITENKIKIPEEYNLFMPKDNLLVITKLFSTQYAVIDITELRILQNTLQRKSIVPSILLALSWTPENELEKNGNKSKAKNGKRKSRKAKKAKRSKNGNNSVKEPPKITMLNFIKRVVVVQQQQPQTQQQ
jgi:hypothetical protein